MKTTLRLILILVISSFTIFSCGDYEEGPSLSLRSKKGRLVGKWKVILLWDDVDWEKHRSNDGKHYQYFVFEKTGDGEIRDEYKVDNEIKSTGGDFDWEWKNDKNSVELTDEDDERLELDINKLTNEELWFEIGGSLWKLEKVD